MAACIARCKKLSVMIGSAFSCLDALCECDRQMDEWCWCTKVRPTASLLVRLHAIIVDNHHFDTEIVRKIILEFKWRKAIYIDGLSVEHLQYIVILCSLCCYLNCSRWYCLVTIYGFKRILLCLARVKKLSNKSYDLRRL